MKHISAVCMMALEVMSSTSCPAQMTTFSMKNTKGAGGIAGLIQTWMKNVTNTATIVRRVISMGVTLRAGALKAIATGTRSALKTFILAWTSGKFVSGLVPLLMNQM